MKKHLLPAVCTASVMLLAGCGNAESGGVWSRNNSSSEAAETTVPTVSVTAPAETSASAGTETEAVTTAPEDASSAAAVTSGTTAVTDSAAPKISITDKTPRFGRIDKQIVEIGDKGHYTEMDTLNYYYNTIDDFHRKIYASIYDICAHTNEKDYYAYISVPAELMEQFSNDFYMVFACVMDDYPDYYRYDETAYLTWDYVSRKVVNGSYEIKVFQTEPFGGYEAEQAKIRAAAAVFLSEIDLSGSEYDIALRIHDKLTDVLSFERSEEKNGLMYSQTIYNALIYGKAVCEGYADTFSYLLRWCGIMCLPIEGGANSGDTYEEAVKYASDEDSDHTWNLMRLDGKWYEADLLWDDLDISEYSDDIQKLICSKPELLEKHRHLYWAVSTKEMADITAFDDFVYYTDSDGTKYSLEYKHSVHLRASDPRAAYYSDSGAYNYRALSEMLPTA